MRLMVEQMLQDVSQWLLLRLSAGRLVGMGTAQSSIVVLADSLDQAIVLYGPGVSQAC
jgi:hypothetical protein